MKALIRVSIVLAILLPISSFGFNLFAFGGCVIPVVTPIAATICVFVSLLTMLVFFFFLVVDLVAVIFLWKRHGKRAFLPLVLIIVAFFVTFPLTWLADSLCHKRFEGHLPQYQRAVAEIEGSITPDGDFNTPGGWPHLSYIPPIAYREDDGTLTIEFPVGGIGPPPRHIAYIYRSNRLIDKDSKTAKRWHHTTKVNEHWFRVSD